LSNDKDTAEEVVQRAELNRARKLAHQRMVRYEAQERARAFAVLDNVSEGELPSWRGRRNNTRSKLDPALNPHIDHEAVEAGDSDSDLQQDNDSFIRSDSSFISDSNIENESLGAEEESGKNGNQRAPTNVHHGQLKSVEFEWEDRSDGSSSDQECTMYEDFAASREVIEAQIDADEKKRKRYQFCDSTDEEQSISNNNQDDESSSVELETEEEASFSSVVGNGSEQESY
jgi:hypothetical protein